ncbi:transcriptional regulator STERILE APETALA [Silene latifolia]|uniref:transcriptional regulator STERILE APETALA n=1 Tax=Silene latifolia TaxID=37657 RepID=UPI003D78815F
MSSRGNGSESSSRRRRRRRPPTPPPPPPPPPSPPPSTAEEYEEMNEGGVWPEPFVEGVATQVAYDVSLSHGSGARLSVAPSLALLFQVCSTWRAISRSELLWQNLVRIVWDRTTLHHPTWRDQYIYHHRTARNFRVRRCSHHLLHPTDHPPPAVPGGAEEEGGAADQLPLFCLRLVLSNDHLAAGFSDGSVRLFYLPTRLHLRTVYPLLRDRLGLYSRAVSGLILGIGNHRLVFASLDGDIHVVSPLAGLGPARRAHLGDVVNDGALVDFAGCERFWVGLYAGVPGGAFRVWDAESEELLSVGGSLTDPESVMGWHMLTELRPTEFVGRVRVLSNGLAVGVTGRRLLVLDLNEHAVVVAEEAPRRGIIVGSMGVNNDTVTTVDSRGVARVRRVRSLEETCRFVVATRGGGAVLLRGLIGCMNDMYVILCVGGVIRVWDVENGEYLYSLRERLEEASAVVASDQYVVASCNTTIHLWDFGA